MNTKYRKYPPKAIFLSFIGRDATEEELWSGAGTGVVYNKQTGIEFFDLFTAMVHRHMNQNAPFYAKQLGVTTAELSGCIKVLTGMTTDEWLVEYRWLAIRELLLDTDRTLGEIATRVGYSSVKSFSRSFIERVGIPPSHWRRKFKRK